MNNHMNHMGHSQDATFFALWRPDIFLIVVLLGALYFYFIGKGRGRFQDAKPVSGKQKFWMVMALLTLYFGQGSPINYYGHSLLFSSHMTQMSLMYLVFPPMVYAGLPDWMIASVLRKPFVKKWVYPFSQPLLALFLFNMMFSFYHIPYIFNAVTASSWGHLTYHWVLVFVSFQMWFPIFVTIPGWNRISDLQRLGYIFAIGVLLTPACALIIFAKTQLYDPYLNAPQLISWLPSIDDQQLGGVIMKIIQEIVYGTILAVTFFRWYRTEKAKEADMDAAFLERSQLPTS
ncbi:cytochrome c oxidase assembly factor CtaG [Paenibacillus sp. J31TS4]|uniref:cytochrome c oxidase assembly protein n=1 Tax=Paenibacillus sp. J31TS4 TaxID=2807195 RepID=UPI001B2418D3|nr:cytochrome c oxidase assembly protein [Paenibacillus sp. J31TS4]GIP41444.1 cytochrome c oxidase assembly factor CtaG [Paenibacillus sp. J31TS4]